MKIDDVNGCTFWIPFFIFAEEVVLWEEEVKQTVIDQTFGMATVRAISLMFY